MERKNSTGNSKSLIIEISADPMLVLEDIEKEMIRRNKYNAQANLEQ